MTAACSFTCLRSCLDISNLKESRKENFQVGAPYYTTCITVEDQRGRVCYSICHYPMGGLLLASFLFFIVEVFLHTRSIPVYKIHFLTMNC